MQMQLHGDNHEPEDGENLLQILFENDKQENLNANNLNYNNHVWNFNFNSEVEMKASECDSIKNPPPGDEIWVCSVCESDNIEEKVWVKVNSGKIGEPCEDGHYFCNKCKKLIHDIITK